jgi:putative transcriptional regulator
MAEKPPDQSAKALRAALGLTQERFAARVGVTVSTVNRWENGKGTPSPLAQQRIEELWREARGRDSE